MSEGFQAAPLTAGVKYLFSANGGEKTVSFSTYSKKASVAWNTASLTFLAAAAKAAVEDAYIPVLSNQHSFLGVIARDLGSEFPEFVEDMEVAAVPGDVASPALPSNVAVAVTWIGKPGSAPKSGRTNLLSPTEAQVTNSLLNGTGQTNLDAVATALQAAMEDPAGVADSSMAIISRHAGTVVVGTHTNGRPIKEAVKRETAVVNGVSQFRVGPRVDTLKKRLPRE